MRLGIIHRYVAREVLVPFALGLFIFTFVLLMFQILKITEMVVNYGIPLSDIFKVLLYVLMPFLVYTIPMALLLGVILAIGRLSSDSELMALKAAGISLAQLVPPVIILSLGAYAVTAFLALQADPWGKQQFKRMLFEVGRRNATLGLKSQVFNDRFENLVIYVRDANTQTRELTGVFIVDERNPEVPNIIVAQRGRLSSAENEMKLIIELTGGSIHRTLADPRLYESAHFDRYDVVLDYSKAVDDATYQKTYLEMSVAELGAFVRSLRADRRDDRLLMRAWVEYHRKFAFPFACVVFGILAIPMGVSPPRSGRGQAFTMAIALLCAYYLLFRVGENLGWKSVLHPFVAMWMPNVIFGTGGAYVLWRKSTEKPVWVLDAAERGFRAVAARLRRRHKAGEDAD